MCLPAPKFQVIEYHVETTGLRSSLVYRHIIRRAPFGYYMTIVPRPGTQPWQWKKSVVLAEVVKIDWTPP